MSRKFCYPRTLYSDNGGAFHQSAKQLEITYHHPTIYDYLTNREIEWKINVSLVPWWDCWYERLIGLAKRCFCKLMGRQTVYFDTLSTMFSEIERIVNDRPLIQTVEGRESIGITPAMLISGKRRDMQPSFEPPPIDTTNLEKCDVEA